MTKAGSNYAVAAISEIARSGDLWVREFTVARDEEVPWHRHSEVQDRCYGLEGIVRVQAEDRSGAWELELQPGQSCVLPAGTRHRLTCARGDQARYLLVQVGKYDFVKVAPPA
ncbi:MAG: cupin domain-containing protein [Hyphomicrobiales bacterium]